MIKDRIYKLLRWSQRYSKTDMVYLAKEGSWLTLSQVISIVASTILAIGFANLLPKEVYGNYKYVISILGILGISNLSGMNAAVSQAVARGHDGVVMPGFVTSVRWGLFGSILGLALGVYYLLVQQPMLAIAMGLGALFLPFMDNLGIYQGVMDGKRLFKKSSIIAILSKIVSVGVMLITIAVTKNFVYMVLSLLATTTLINLIVFIHSMKRDINNNSIDPKTISYGKHLSAIGIINTIASNLDSILVFHFLGAVPLAVYSIAIAAPERLKRIMGILETLLFPKYATRDAIDIRSDMRTKFLRLLIVGIVVIGVYILAAPILYHLFFPAYPNAVFISQLFSISMLNVALFPAGTFLRAKRMIREQYISNVVSSCFQIISMTLLTMSYGLIGLVVARIASRYFGSALNVFFSYRAPVDTDQSTAARGLPM